MKKNAEHINECENNKRYLYLRSVFYVVKTPKTLIDKNEADEMPSTHLFIFLTIAVCRFHWQAITDFVS